MKRITIASNSCLRAVFGIKMKDSHMKANIPTPIIKSYYDKAVLENYQHLWTSRTLFGPSSSQISEQMATNSPLTTINGTVHFKKCKQLFEGHHLLFLRDIWWSKF
jgi:hypothetical protein